MLTPSDPHLREIVETAADDLLSEIDMVLDEGSWISRIYNRCDALGIDLPEATQIREICEELLALQAARHLLGRLVIDLSSEVHDGEVFVQGAGWIKNWPRDTSQGKEEDAG